MNRIMKWIGLLATAVLFVMVVVNIVREPARQAGALSDYQAAAVDRGMTTYAQHCARCHGAGGEGLGVYRALDQDFVRQQDERLLFNTVERGRYATDMAPFGINEGGALSHGQIDNLVLLLQLGDWPAIEQRVADLDLMPTEADILAAMGPDLTLPLAEVGDGETLALAQSLFAEHCVECHGENGEGTADAPALNDPYVRNMPVAQVYEIVTIGVRNTEMEGFEGTLTVDDIAALIYLLQNGAFGPEALAAVDPGPDLAALAEGLDGQVLFQTWCAICHGVRGEGGSIAPSLNDIPALSADFITSRVRGGKNAMPPFPEADVTPNQLAAIILYAQGNIFGSGLPVYTPEELAAARDTYILHCAECHGDSGEGTPADGPRIVTSPPMRAVAIINFVRVGSVDTPAITAAEVSEADLALIVAYLHSLAR